MYDEIAEAGISGLDGVHQALRAGHNNRALKLTQGLLKRRQKYLGGLNADELKGLTPTPRTLYCTRRIQGASSIAQNTELDFFRKGEGDDADNLGYAVGTITAAHTNIGKDGTIPQGEIFVCNGIAFEFDDAIGLTDLKGLQKGQVQWIENSGTTVLPLATVREMPADYRLGLEFDGAASPTDRNLVQLGRHYRFKRPLFIIRGMNSRSDEGFLRVTLPEAFFLNSSDVFVTARLYGTWFQSVGRR